MRQGAALFGPIVEVRDVLESFLRDQVLMPDWRQRLTEASHQFIDLGSADETVGVLGGRIRRLAVSELSNEPALVRSVAAAVEQMLDEVEVPDLPRPGDDDWSF